MHIARPVLTSEHGELTWSVSVEGLAGAPDHLWYRLPERHAELVTDLVDPAVIGLLIPAMHAAEPIDVGGPVTDELVHNLRHGYQHVLEIVVPGLSRIPLNTPITVPAGGPARGVGTGFSAGVDSFAVLAEHHFANTPDALRLTHLTYFNVGSHTSGERGRSIFHRRYGQLSPVAEAIGLPFIPIDSNLDDFYSFTHFQQTNGPRNISAAALLQAGIGRYYLAGSVHFRNVRVRRMYDTAYSDPISLPLLTTGQFRPTSHGDQYTRVEKTLIVAHTSASHSSLDVCTNSPSSGGNCSHCPKCLRTELTLEIIGHLENFRSVFDLAVYERHRTSFMDWIVIARKSKLAGEIRDHAQRVGFRLPPILIAAPRHGARIAARNSLFFARRVRRRLTAREGRRLFGGTAMRRRG
jgi:hypothetical protein